MMTDNKTWDLVDDKNGLEFGSDVRGSVYVGGQRKENSITRLLLSNTLDVNMMVLLLKLYVYLVYFQSYYDTNFLNWIENVEQQMNIQKKINKMDNPCIITTLEMKCWKGKDVRCHFG